MTTAILTPMQPVLSPYASEHFNASFLQELSYLASDVAAILEDDLIAVVLGGGFGRGEGCIVTIDQEEKPYNDVDLFLITRTKSPKGMKKLKHLAERYENRLGIAVDFSSPQTPAMIARWEPLLMWQELLHGHRVLIGPEDVLTANAPHGLLEQLPNIEAGRMMLNRGAGLLWAARVCRSLEPVPDESFVERNFFKCCQALGDAVLIAAGAYLSDPVEKVVRLNELVSRLPIIHTLNIVEHFERAVEFRKSPLKHSVVTQVNVIELATTWLTLFTWLESNRHGRGFENIGKYLSWDGLREDPKYGYIKTLATNIRRRRFSVRHPREAVYRTLPQALDALVKDAATFPALSQRALLRWREAA